MSEHTERLQFLANRWSQAEIARKTETQRNNVSRYMRGGKMPLEFAAQLTRRMGVNPAWLLVGEGTPFLSDVNASAEKTAGDLLELVEAMNSVASLQLGSLTGKHHLRVLRELNDALARYDELRKRINAHTGPIFAQILDDYWAALDRWQLDKADDFRRAAEQVARLCEDDALLERFERTLSYHAFLRRDEEESIHFQSRVFRRRLAGAGIDEPGLQEVFNLANALQSYARLDAALALCESAVALAGKRGRAWPICRLIHALGGYILMETGDALEGLKRVVDAAPQANPAWRELQHSMAIRGQLLTGAVDFERAMDMGGKGPAHAQGMLVYALWLEDPALLDAAAERYLPEEVDPADMNSRVVRAVIELNHGRRKPARDFLKDFAPRAKRPLNEQFDSEVFGATVARLVGAGDAKQRLNRANKLLTDTDNDRTFGILARAMHHRNALQLTGSRSALYRQAKDFFRVHHERGCGCFSHLTD